MPAKTPAAVRRANAKRAETTKLRPLRELKEEAEQVAKHFRAFGAHEGREDAKVLGWLIRCAASQLGRVPIPAESVEALHLVVFAVNDSVRSPTDMPHRAGCPYHAIAVIHDGEVRVPGPYARRLEDAADQSTIRKLKGKRAVQSAPAHAPPRPGWLRELLDDALNAPPEPEDGACEG